MAGIPFVKMHGLGNDFLVMPDLAEELDFTPEAVEFLCDRNFGVGADGLILVRPGTAEGAEFLMLYFNADGTVAEMCGNGIRCFAKYLVDNGLVPSDEDVLSVQTLGGVKRIEVVRDYCGKMYAATVDMGDPILAPAEIPTSLACDRTFECPLETDAGTFAVTAVSMGNPHAVVWVDDVEAAPVDTAGPAIETHAAFPNKTNVEFAELVDAERIRLRVWERGVGETLACGTGACATLVASVLGGYTGRSATIELPGGELQITWSAEDGRVYMTGPATEVFSGELPVDEEDADEEA